MQRCVIVGGAPIGDYNRIKSYLRMDDFIIFCDSGLKHLENLDVRPSMVVGDFDSFELEEACRKIGLQSKTLENTSSESTSIITPEIIVLPKEKDDTDTLYAAKTAISKGFNEFLVIGVLGKRMDHSLANLAMLGLLAQEGAEAIIVDDYSEIEVVHEKQSTMVADHFRYFSLLAVFGVASDVTISNAKFPVEQAAITPFDPYAVSNEPLKGGSIVRIGKGMLLLIKDFE